MKPDSPKEYMLQSLYNLIKLIEEDKIVLQNIKEKIIYMPFPNEFIPQGRRITLELYNAT